MSEEMDYSDLDAVIDDSAVQETGISGNDDFSILPKGTYAFEINKVEFSNYQPKPGKTTGITKPCKKITIGLIVDGGDAGHGWADENLYFYPSCMFRILSVFKCVGLISDGYKGSLPWDQLKGSSGTAKFDVESYHSTKYGDERKKMVVKQFIKAAAPAALKPAEDDLEDIPF